VIVVPEPGRWRFAAGLAGTPIRIEHIEDDDFYNVAPYWHVQHLIISELDATALRGLGPGIGLALTVPLRLVRDRIRYEDLARQPYVPPYPDLHHRNETLFRLGDVSVALPLTRPAGRWTLGASVGLSLPTGRTESDPFELGELGLPHQHIQFGTGTLDPLIGASVSRESGGTSWSASGNARLTLYQNAHEYRAGDRFGLAAGVGRTFGGIWNGNAGLALVNEQAERWHGEIQSEGNLGRTDLNLNLGFGRTVSSTGVWTLAAQVPVASHSVGEQARIPVIFSLGWSK
jgi:hypothetical protein